MAEETPEVISSPEPAITIDEPKAKESPEIPTEFLKKPDPKSVDAFVQKATTDDIDLDSLTAQIDIEVKSMGADTSRIDNAVQSALDRYSRKKGIETRQLEQQLVSQKVNPLQIASELSKGSELVDVIEGIKSRTLAGQTKSQRATRLRGKTIADIGRARADAGIGRTVETTGETPIELLIDEDRAQIDDSESSGFFGTDIEDVKEAPKPGDPLFAELQQINDMFERTAAEGDVRSKRIVELRDKYKEAEQGAIKFVPERAADILSGMGIFEPEVLDSNRLQQLRNAGREQEIAANKAARKRYDDALERAQNRALKEIAIWKTLGLWTAPAFYRYDQAGVTDPEKELSFGEAFSPTIEVVGVDRNGNPITRGQSAMQWGFEINDLIQSALIGSVTEDHADLGQRMLRGIAKRRNAFELALDSDIAQTSTGAKVGLGLVGFAAAVLTPDLTFGAASVARRSSISLTKVFRRQELIEISEQHEVVAKKLAEAVQTGDRDLLSEVAVLDGKVRAKAKVAMDRVDQSDFDAARRLARNNPDILATKQGNELADKLPGRLGDNRMNLHPSVRRRQAREGRVEGRPAPDTDFQEAAGIGYRQAYDYGDQLDEVDKMRALVNEKDRAVYERFVRKSMVGESGAFKAAVDLVTEVGKKAPSAAAAMSRVLNDYTALARDPEAWGNTVRSVLNDIVDEAGDDASKIVKIVDGSTDEVGLIETMQVAARGAIEDAGDFETMGKLIDRAEEAIKTNIESRAIAHAFDRSLIHGELGLKTSPIIAESTAKVKELQELSDEAISFMDQAIEVFKVTKDEAIESARIFDLASVRWGNRTGQSPAKWWQTRLKGLKTQEDFKKKFGIEQPGTVFSSVYHPAYQAQAALPAGYRLVGVGETVARLVGNPSAVRRQLMRWLVKNRPEFFAKEPPPLTGEPPIPGSEAAVLARLLSTADATGPSLFKVRKGAYKKGPQGDYDFNQDALSDFIEGEDAAFLSGFFDELREAGHLVQEPSSWKIINEETGAVLSEGDDALSTLNEALNTLVKDGVITLTPADVEMGHKLVVGPIAYGMDIDTVDQAIGGYNFEYGAGWADGVSIFRKEGARTSVPMTSTEFAVFSTAKNSQFTHNHPNYSWFSGATGDMSFCAGNNVNDFRVVWPDGTVIQIEAPNGWGKLAHVTRASFDTGLGKLGAQTLDEIDPSGILSTTSLTESFTEHTKWRRKVGSYIMGPSRKVANNVRKEATRAGREFSQRDYAIAFAEEANRRLVETARKDFGIDLRVSIRQPEESRKLGQDRPGAPTDRLTASVGADAVDAMGGGLEVLFQGVKRQPGVEFKELDDGLVEITTKLVRDDGSDGLTFRVVDNTLTIDSVNIGSSIRGIGVGTDLYRNAFEYAISKGFGFASDLSPNRDAVVVYERMISAGAPLTRKIVRGPDGALVRQYVADSKTLRQFGLRTAKVDPQGRVSFLDKGTIGAPGGSPARLSPIQAAVRRLQNFDNPAFKKFFGASKAVDDRGLPLVVHHGTDSKFESFNMDYAGDFGNYLGKGAYFTTNPAIADRFSKARDLMAGRRVDPDKNIVLNVHLRTENPYEWPPGKIGDTNSLNGFMDGTGSMPDEIASDVFAKLDLPPNSTYADMRQSFGTFEAEGILAKAVQDVLKDKGYDGVKRINPDDGSIEWVVFEPNQIKSVENIGTFDPNDPRIMYQAVSDDDAAKGAVEFLEDGRAIIYALEQPDFTTLVHEMGHILRRDLGVDEFEKVGSWVQSLGANVQMRAGRFVGDADEIRKAEEFFAEAFEQYIKDGEPPIEDLRGAFEKMKEYMVNAVKYLLPSTAKVTPEMKQIFDDLLVTAKPDSALLPRVSKMVKETIMGKTASEFDTVQAISDEALRLGIDNASYDDLIKQLEETGKIKLEGRIFADRFPATDEVAGGVDEFSSSELADLRRQMQAEIETEKIVQTEVGTGAAASSFSQAIRERTPSEKVEQLLSGDGATARVREIVKGSFIGGNVTAEKGLSSLAPTVRARIETATRMVKQGTAEGIRLVGEATNQAGRKNLIDFLTGENVAYIKGGRRVLTSGHDSVSAVFSEVTKYIAKQADETSEMKNLIGLANHKGAGGDLETFSFGEVAAEGGRRLTKGEAEKAWNALFRGNSTPRFLKNLFESLNPVTASGANPLPEDFFDFTEVLMYYAGASRRDGAKFVGSPKDQIDLFMKEVEGLYGKPASMRVAVLVATFGHAERARKLWSGLGLAIDQKSFTSMTKWLNGEDIPPSDIPKVKKLVARFGLNTQFVEESLLGTTFYVPKAARDRLGNALVRGIDPEVKGVLKSEQNITGLTGVFLRYNKLRMTRGGIALRQRYFLMNTIDHFAQMLMINGLRPAISSTMRVLAQDVMVLPGVARSIDTLSRTGVLKPDAAEKVRKSLQSKGDVLADFFGRAKYNIKINPILEGDEGFVRLGGNVYTNKELRDIAVDEGIFASFDTTQLTNAVQRAGRELIDETVDDASKLNRSFESGRYAAEQTAEFLTQVISDTAEAWGERERLGAMISLMETGLAPRQAARLTIDALYDYAGSLTTLDRNWLVSLMLPFWAFQKNANRQFFDTLFSPSGVYRMGVLRRGTERTADALTEIMWNSVSDEYGVDTRALESADPNLYQDYMLIKNNILDHYGGKVPEDVRIGMNMWLRGESVRLKDGARFFFSAEGAPQQKDFAALQKRYADFVRPLPSKSARASYLRDRSGVLIPFSLMEEETRRYYNAIRDSKVDHGYAEVFFPDSTINAGMRHMANMAAFYVLAALKGVDALVPGIDIEGLDEVSLGTPLSQVADAERAPVIGDAAKAITGVEGYPRKVHPVLKSIFETTFPGVRTLEFQAKDDIYSPPDLREGVEYQETRSYMFPGAWSIVFDNTLGEVNNLLYDMDPVLNLAGIEGRGRTSPAERAAKVRLLQWARTTIGLQTGESSPDQTAQRERRTRMIETDRPR